MAINEDDRTGTRNPEPHWPHESDGDSLFTEGCPECDATQVILAVECELRLAVRDLWIDGWRPTHLVDEARRRTGSPAVRPLVIAAYLADDMRWSDEAKSPLWRREIDVLAATSGIEPMRVGWAARWIGAQQSGDVAFELLCDLGDELDDIRSRGHR